MRFAEYLEKSKRRKLRGVEHPGIRGGQYYYDVHGNVIYGTPPVRQHALRVALHSVFGSPEADALRQKHGHSREWAGGCCYAAAVAIQTWLKRAGIPGDLCFIESFEKHGSPLDGEWPIHVVCRIHDAHGMPLYLDAEGAWTEPEVIRAWQRWGYRSAHIVPEYADAMEAQWLSEYPELSAKMADLLIHRLGTARLKP